MIVAFDIDGCLLNEMDRPRYDVIDIMRWFYDHGHKVYLWSGSGMDWAERVSNRLGLPITDIIVKGSKPVDIAFDDQEVELGKVNIQV